MIYNLSEQNSLAGHYLAELRDVAIQGDRLRFRKNMERLGSILAFEISKQLKYCQKEIETPLKKCQVRVLAQPPVLATILRAGLALHEGLLQFFDGADCALISAYRKHDNHNNFKIQLGYMTCPPIQDRDLIVSDPMLATGSSLELIVNDLLKVGTPSSLHIVTVISSQVGIKRIQNAFSNAHIWTAAIDSELNDHAYIVPGLGDAGDLAYGEKLQS